MHGKNLKFFFGCIELRTRNMYAKWNWNLWSMNDKWYIIFAGTVEAVKLTQQQRIILHT
jgi:hypothetical protein